MPRFKNVNGVDVQLTSEEETARDIEEAAIVTNAPKVAAQAEINRLEATITSRRIREASADTAAGSAAGRTWLKNVDDLITIERAKLF